MNDKTLPLESLDKPTGKSDKVNHVCSKCEKARLHKEMQQRNLDNEDKNK